LSSAKREPRGAIDVDVVAQGGMVRVVATHLGLRWRERRTQAGRLIDIFARRVTTTDEDAASDILLGDLNEWRPIRNSLQPILDEFDPSPAPATFPARYPMLALDRILVRNGLRLCDLRPHRSKLARLASDHLPVLATAAWLPGRARSVPAIAAG
jgi:endonuclease/exonuclease/phosphatase family metal-dependent hydrolase